MGCYSNLSVWRYSAFLVWCCFALAAGVLVFTGGFLLKRQVLPNKAFCQNLDHNDTLRTNLPAGSDWRCNAVPRHYSKAVVIVVDALKYEFAVGHGDGNLDRRNDSGGVVAGADHDGTEYFRNRLPVIREAEERGLGKLYEFMADPPTTTMQRLKGLTTGSLPTFIDLSSNFASYEVDEDNIVDQLVRQGKRVVFAGDDTWMGLFPGRFTRSYPYPSFDVWDLDTVDKGVTSRLEEELRQPDQWDVFIGHYLGVDHAGHKFGPRHPEMRRKLDEMNGVLSMVTARLPDDCVLFVMGDHGMTMTGDHGGDTNDELSAALFIYSNAAAGHSESFREDIRRPSSSTVNQVDFVPTFSLLLGLPIPFSNLGKVIGGAMVTSSGGDFGFGPNKGMKNDTGMDKTKLRQVQYVAANVEQVSRYLDTYATAAPGSPLPKLPGFNSVRAMAGEFLQRRRRQDGGSSDGAVLRSADVESMLSLGNSVLEDAKAICHSTFVEFDLDSITLGLTVTFVNLVLILVLVVMVATAGQIRALVNTGFIANVLSAFAGGVVLSALIDYRLHHQSQQRPEQQPPETWSVSLHNVGIWSVTLSTVTFGLTLLWRLRRSAVQNLTSVRRQLAGLKSQVGLLHAALFMVLSFGLFSNSFVVEEAQLHHFGFLSSVLAYALSGSVLLKSNPQQKQWPSLILLLVTLGLTRCASVYFRCREEQLGWCTATEYHKPLANLLHTASRTYKNWRFFFTILSVAVTATLPSFWLRRCGNLNGISLPVVAAQYAPPTAGLALVFNWALQGLPGDMASSLLPWQQFFLARVALAVCLASLAVILICPKLLYVSDAGANLAGNGYTCGGNAGGGSWTSTASPLILAGLDPAHLLTAAGGGDGVRTYYNLLKSNWKQHLVMNPILQQQQQQEGHPHHQQQGSGGAAHRKILLYGIGTCISAVFVHIGVVFSLSSMLVLGDGLCPSMCLAFMLSGLYLYHTTVVRLSSGPSSPAELLKVPWSTVVGWHILEGLFFYATGHQPTFPSINWNAAFSLGGSSSFGSSSSSTEGTTDAAASNFLVAYVLPAVLVGWNTFVARMWFGVMLPLLMLAPFALGLMFPSLRPNATTSRSTSSSKGSKSSNGGSTTAVDPLSAPSTTVAALAAEEMAKGEMYLVENPDEAVAQLFGLCLKYCSIQAARTFLCMLAASLLRRHLMVWKIFAPRFIFEAVGLFVSLCAVLVGFAIFVRALKSLVKLYRNIVA